ncbi:hypothetical protein B0O80DRAFT_446392 [Mortierella sp. GBAus27b]|nr:hypothetical protein BGX31_009726 [Mortierella sp. GBA43]KAI8357040.1 hypothetical protein B0O80DRAFT_446392 [Mortierella sp. GBAus27b]
MTDLDHHSKGSLAQVSDDDGSDDIWDESDGVSYDRAIAEREWTRLHETFGNTGYREGIEEGKEETLQQGFDRGWAEGVQYGHDLGRLRGLISPLVEYLGSSLPSTSSSLFKTAQAKEVWIKKASELTKELVELDIAKVFDKAYFDDGRKPTTTSKSIPANSAESGCYGGKDKDSCCRGDTVQGEPSSSSPSTGECCSSKTTDSPCLSGGCGTVAKDTSKDWSSRPEQLIADYRSRVSDLLNQVGLGSLLETA